MKRLLNILKLLAYKTPLIKHALENYYNLIEIRKNTQKTKFFSESPHHINIENYIDKFLYKNPKYQDDKRLNKFESQVYSQHGEDGIIVEIFKRIGETNKFFVEFGAQTGMTNNTTLLLTKGWSGSWIEGSQEHIKEINKKFNSLINNGKLSIKNAFITAENTEKLFEELNVPKNFDLLSIDIDGNDYWVWKAIQNYSPRVVILEYNAIFTPDIKWVMKYNPQHIWDLSSYCGASLKSLEILAHEKGYRLVGCDFTGGNAFFVKEDLVQHKFLAPFTAENHYEPPRYFLLRELGHPTNFGDFESV